HPQNLPNTAPALWDRCYTQGPCKNWSRYTTPPDNRHLPDGYPDPGHRGYSIYKARHAYRQIRGWVRKYPEHFFQALLPPNHEPPGFFHGVGAKVSLESRYAGSWDP